MIRPATLTDVCHIGETMWDRGKEELTYLGISAPLWFAGWVERLKRKDAVAFGDHAILGWDNAEGGVCTSFQASKSFELPGVGKQVTKALRKAIPQLMREEGVRLCITYSLCVDPEAPKWFRLLGFEEDTNYLGLKRGPYMTRRFVRRA